MKSGNMNVSLGKRWEQFVEEAVQSGRYNSSSEVVREGLRLVEEREHKLAALRATLAAALESGPDLTPDQVAQELRDDLAKVQIG